MRLTDTDKDICKCGHAIWYHGGRCTFKGCNCWKFFQDKKIKESKDNSSGAFLGGFTYTEDQICKCKHGSWDHCAPMGTRISKCRHWKCKCKMFESHLDDFLRIRKKKKIIKKKEVRNGKRKSKRKTKRI